MRLSDFYKEHFSDLCCYEDYLMRVDLMGKPHDDKEILDSLPKCANHRYIIVNGEIIWIDENGEKVENPGITYIPVHAFEYCSDIQKVVIPDSVKNIEDYAFSWCEGLTSVTIPDGVTNIGSSAFSDCRNLKCMTIPSSVKSIGDGAFYGCYGLESVTVPSSVTDIGELAFLECWELKFAKVPKGCKIGRNAFPKYCKVIRY